MTATLTERLTDTRRVTVYAHRTAAGPDLLDLIDTESLDVVARDGWSGLLTVAGPAVSGEELADRLRLAASRYGVAVTVTALP